MSICQVCPPEIGQAENASEAVASSFLKKADGLAALTAAFTRGLPGHELAITLAQTERKHHDYENGPANSTEKINPIDDVRQGTVRIPIWQNSGENGPYVMAGQPENSYQQDGTWLPATSCSEFDLECLALAALEVRKKIRQLRKVVRLTRKTKADIADIQMGASPEKSGPVFWLQSRAEEFTRIAKSMKLVDGARIARSDEVLFSLLLDMPGIELAEQPPYVARVAPAHSLQGFGGFAVRFELRLLAS